jgi:hypothetical protein
VSHLSLMTYSHDGYGLGHLRRNTNIAANFVQQAPGSLEKLYVFLRHLSAKLPRRRGGPAYQFDEDVRLEYYRLQKISEGSISLREGRATRLDGPSEVGSGLGCGQPGPSLRGQKGKKEIRSSTSPRITSITTKNEP